MLTPSTLFSAFGEIFIFILFINAIDCHYQFRSQNLKTCNSLIASFVLLHFAHQFATSLEYLELLQSRKAILNVLIHPFISFVLKYILKPHFEVGAYCMIYPLFSSLFPGVLLNCLCSAFVSLLGIVISVDIKITNRNYWQRGLVKNKQETSNFLFYLSVFLKCAQGHYVLKCLHLNFKLFSCY